MSQPHYSDDLTSHEATLGFEKVFILNPEGGFYGHGSIVPSVIFRLGPCDIIIKMNNPISGQPEYSHQKYGTYGSSGRPDWKPVLVPFPSPEMAISAAQSGRDQTGPGAAPVNIVPATMPLRCPQCTHEFELNVDHVPFGSQQSCPSCSAVDDIANFNAINL